MAVNTENNNVLQDRWPEKKELELSLRTDVEKIMLYFQGKLPNTTLSAALEEKVNRMKETDRLITKYGGAKKVIPILENKYGISFSTAKRLYDETQDAYGYATHFNRQYHLDLYFNKLIEGINLSKDAGDWRSYGMLLKEYNQAIKDHMGTSLEEAYKNIQVPETSYGFFPEELKTKIPANWRARVEKLKESKRKDEIEEAIILTSEDEQNPL